MNTTSPMDRFHIHQIHYDTASRAMLDPGFIHLDNSYDARPDWFEFWPIRKYLQSNELIDGHWYGFLSPKFFHKTGLQSEHVYRFLHFCDQNSIDVGLALCHFDALAFYWNCFEQGDVAHTGLPDVTQQWLDQSNIPIDLKTLTTHSRNFTYCNYIFAKKSYWLEWLKFSDCLYDAAENGTSPLKEKLNAKTLYAGKQSIPMKVFIQERFPALIIHKNKFNTITTEHPKNHMNLALQSLPNLYRNSFLMTLNYLKIMFESTQDETIKNDFIELRKKMLTSFGQQEFSDSLMKN